MYEPEKDDDRDDNENDLGRELRDSLWGDE